MLPCIFVKLKQKRGGLAFKVNPMQDLIVARNAQIAVSESRYAISIYYHDHAYEHL
jgi:hypothetical protein